MPDTVNYKHVQQTATFISGRFYPEQHKRKTIIMLKYVSGEQIFLLLILACSHYVQADILSSTAIPVSASQQNPLSSEAVFPTTTLKPHTRLSGMVAHRDMIYPATVTIKDQQGKIRQVRTNNHGRYHADVSDMLAPLRLSAIETGGENCLLSNKPRAICLSALVPIPIEGQENIININPLTDRIASDVATATGYIGPQQLIDDAILPALKTSAWESAYLAFHNGFDNALKQAGITAPEQFDPLKYTADQRQAVKRVLQVINHARNYHNNTGQAGHTVLTDIAFRPIVDLNAQGSYEPLDYTFAYQRLNALKKASVRIFIVGDSTAATYEKARFPRMGWGQVFEQQFRPASNVKVVNGARSGRSSRDFYNEGWFRQMEPFMRRGDYMFINMGHNDQNCNGSKAVRGIADVENLCTYPNNAAGKLQYPAGKPDMSFQMSLKRYIRYAQQHHMTPVLLTPTTRVKNAAGKSGTPVVHSHFTRQNAADGYAFVGDYSQTIKDTAKDTQIPLLDIETATIALANQHDGTQWQQYWLAVDPVIYPYYQDQSGSLSKPDTTHFQQKGAIAVSTIVADAIRHTPKLHTLAEKLVQNVR